MNEDELEKLMNEKLDGVGSPEDSARLDEELSRRPEAREAFRRLGGVFSVLDRVGLVEPPPDLKPNVIRTIRQREEPAPAHGSWLDEIAALFRKRPAFRYAYSFAAGAALGAVVLAVATGDLGRRSMSMDSLSGAMAPLARESALTPIDRMEFGVGEGRVVVETLADREHLVASITSNAPKGAEIEVSFDPSTLSAVALVKPPTSTNVVTVGPDRFMIAVREAGQSRYLVSLARTGPAGSPIRLVVRGAGGLIQGDLRTGTRPSGT